MRSTRDMHSFDTASRALPRPATVALCMLLAASLATASFSAAVAQSAAPAQQAAAPSPDAIKQREQELEAAREQQSKAAELQQKLKADIAAIGQDRSKLNQQLIEIATQVRGVETRIGETEAPLRPLDSREQASPGFARFTPRRNRRGAGGTARAGRRTPPALLVRPEDALQSLRTAMLLGSVVPELRVRAEKLAADLGELVRFARPSRPSATYWRRDRDKLKDDSDPAGRPGGRAAA